MDNVLILENTNVCMVFQIRWIWSITLQSSSKICQSSGTNQTSLVKMVRIRVHSFIQFLHLLIYFHHLFFWLKFKGKNFKIWKKSIYVEKIVSTSWRGINFISNIFRNFLSASTSFRRDLLRIAMLVVRVKFLNPSSAPEASCCAYLWSQLGRVAPITFTLNVLAKTQHTFECPLMFGSISCRGSNIRPECNMPVPGL